MNLLKHKLTAAILGAGLLMPAAFPYQAEAGTSAANVEKMVKQAESYAGSLKWAISIEGTGDGKSVPWDHYNGTKNSYKTALKGVTSLPKGAKRTELEKRLEEKVNLYISTENGKTGRAVAYIDAINAGKIIDGAKLALKTKIDAGILNKETEELYHNLSWELKKQSFLLDRVYGQSTRDLIRQNFKKSAEQVREQAKYPVSIMMALDTAKIYIDLNNSRSAKQYLDEAKALFEKGSSAGLLNPYSAVYFTLENRYQQYEKLAGANEVEMESSSIGYGDKIQPLDQNENSTLYSDLMQAYPLKEFKVNLNNVAKKIEISAAVTRDGRETTVELGSAENVRTMSVNLSTQALFLLPDPRLKETDGFEGAKYIFTIKITNSFDQVSLKKVNFAIGKYVYGNGFTDGTFLSKYGFKINVPKGYKLFQQERSSSISIQKNDNCIVLDPQEGTVSCDPTGGLSVKVLDSKTDVAALQSEALESEGTSVVEVSSKILDSEKYHVTAKAKNSPYHLYELVAEIDGRLIQVHYYAESDNESVKKMIAGILTSIDFQ